MKHLLAIASLAVVAGVSVVPGTARAEVYLTKDQALELVFGKDCEQHYLQKEIPEALEKQLDDADVRGDEKKANFFSCTKDGKITGYALIDNEVGKHLPITYIVGISPSGTVTRVEIMVFREVRGWEARERRFMQQFEGKGPTDTLKVGREISNVSGATLSSSAIARGVKRALLMWRYFFGEVR